MFEKSDVKLRWNTSEPQIQTYPFLLYEEFLHYIHYTKILKKSIIT